jgi:hypothetical protein
MSQKSDGMNYAPQGKPSPVVKPGEFVFGAAHLEHGHIYGQCNGLLEAGAQLKWVYDPDPKKVEAFVAKYPQVKVARSLDEILDDREVKLLAAAAVPSERGALGCRVMESGRDYFTDKTPFTSLSQLDQAKAVVARTGRKYAVYFSERLHVESAMYATDLVASGAIGRVLQVIGLGPHRLGKAGRPAWFFEKAKFGGILTDIGSHQFEHAGRRGELREPRQARVRGFRRGLAPRQQRRVELHSRRLVHARRPEHLGRRPHDHPRHQGDDRAAQICRRRPRKNRRPRLHHRRKR